MIQIVLIGMKSCGKTTISKLLAKKLNIQSIDSDIEIENLHKKEKGEVLTFREIFKKYGEKYFNILDSRTLTDIAERFKNKDFVFACAGRTPLQRINQKLLKRLGTIIYLKPNKEALYQRTIKNGIPAFFPYPANPRRSFNEILAKRQSTYSKIADIILECNTLSPEKIADIILASYRTCLGIPVEIH